MRLPVFAALMLPLSALAQSAMTAEDFIRQVAEDNIADVEAGRMAQTSKTVPESIRQLGRQITADAMTINDRLSRLAVARSVPLSNQISAADRQALNRLSKLEGPAFAREYLRYVMDDLEQDRARYQVGSTLDDRPVADFAKQALPELDKELQVAQALYDAQVARAPSR
jgi:predicted outer membrane protein